ncbi:MAG: HlyD family secretion protein [Deltaproteobacteria bacterium]|nr:HlyD family secretion protein [Deltaproteobacteria bacterium]
MSDGKNPTENPDQEKGPRRRKKWVFYALIGLLAVGLGIGGYWRFFLKGRVSTDDAYVVVDIASVSSRINGTVSEVLVENDQFVKEGRVLVELDARDYRVAVDKAQGALAQIEADVQSATMDVQLVDSKTKDHVLAAEAALKGAKYQVEVEKNRLNRLQKELQSAKADLDYAQKELKRYETLYEHRSVSEEQRDRVLKRLDDAKSALGALKDRIRGSKASIASAHEQVGQSEARLKIAESNRKKVDIQVQRLKSLKARRDQARAALKQARLNLSYCTIRAPLSGSVAQRDVQVGNRILPGEPVMAIVPLQAAYVEANFKETQLKNVRAGQPATVKADIYPSHTYHGRVAGIAAGTGAAFSLLPPENATGNWVKVVRRVPVRILLNKPPPSRYPLRMGLSLEVTIETDGGNSDTSKN